MSTIYIEDGPYSAGSYSIKSIPAGHVKRIASTDQMITMGQATTDGQVIIDGQWVITKYPVS